MPAPWLIRRRRGCRPPGAPLWRTLACQREPRSFEALGGSGSGGRSIACVITSLSIVSTASKMGLKSRWVELTRPLATLFDAAKIGLPHLDPELETIYRGKRLAVHRAGVKYLLATKLMAGRPVDLEDAVHLAIAADITTREGMLNLLEAPFPTSMLTPRVQYTVELVASDVAAQMKRSIDF